MLQRKTKKALLNEYKAINKEHPLADTIQSIKGVLKPYFQI